MTSVAYSHDAAFRFSPREFFPRVPTRARSPQSRVMSADRDDDRSTAMRDLVIIVVATILFAVASVWFDLGDRMLALMQPNGHYEIDELPGLLVFIALAVAVFAWRRMIEARMALGRRREAEHELSAALDANRRLARENVRIQEEERRRLARELHDEFGQYLNAIKVDAVSIRKGARSAHDGAESIIGITDHVQSVMRETIGRLRPAGLDELGLTAALEDCIDGWRKRTPEIAFEFTPPDAVIEWDETVNIALYRVVQEGVSNVAKHADATHVEIHLEAPLTGAAAGEIKLTVRNDGDARGAASAGSGLGIVSMRERVESLGGRLTAGPLPGGGFRLCAILPANPRSETES